MFDTLIESSFEKRKRPTGPYLLVASIAYFVLLIGAASVAIMWFNPGLVEALELNARLAAPAPMVTAAPREAHGSVANSASAVASAVPSAESPSLRISPDLPPIIGEQAKKVIGTGFARQIGGVPGGATEGPGGSGALGNAPAPPPREPAPTPTPGVAKPPEKTVVSEGVLQGIAINKFTPAYPEIAKKAAIQGQVQVQVLISEDGRVIEATVLNGNPLLRNTAREAARRWLFTPTKLSGVPVKVQGILTFDFKLH